MRTYNLDFKKARQLLKNSPISHFSEYSSAYTITNEDLRFMTGLSDLAGARVLTMAGSGDHPIFYALAGAAHIDTFDISFCAKAIMDVKTAAIPAFDHLEYYNGLIYAMYGADNVFNMPRIKELNCFLPTQTNDFMQETNGYKIFTKGLGPNAYKEFLPTKDEFKLLREHRIVGPFDFIWTDVCNLHDHLESKYDVINLSNVFQYIRSLNTTDTIMNGLGQHLTPDGIIVCHNTPPYQSNCNWNQTRLLMPGKSTAFVLKKIR
jgi:hypothetical protein